MASAREKPHIGLQVGISMQSFVLDGVMLVLFLSLIPMVCIAVAAGIVALIQAATQIQEQSVTHLVRLLAFGVVIAIAGDWAGGEVVAFFERAVKAVEAVGRGP